MLRNISVFLVILCVSVLANAQRVHGNLESENVFTSDAAKPQLNGYVQGSFNEKVGWSSFGILSNGWGQLYGGPTYSPKKWITFSGSVGFEATDRVGWRTAESVWIGKGKFSLLAIQEQGAVTGHWHKNVFAWQATKVVGAGVWNEFGKGTGPFVQLNISHHFDVYIAPLVNTDGKTHLILGAHKNF